MKAVYLKDNNNNKVVTVPYYRVGDLFLTTIATNPSNFLGGKWELFGPGRCLVCVDTSQTEFNSVKKTGGEKSHTLTIAEMPSHTHIQNSHKHNIPYRNDGGPYDVSIYFSYNGGNVKTWWNSSICTDTTTATNQNTGGGGAHNNLQPYITCYIWIRTA